MTTYRKKIRPLSLALVAAGLLAPANFALAQTAMPGPAPGPAPEEPQRRPVTAAEKAAIEREGTRAAEALAENMRVAKKFAQRFPEYKFARFGCFFGAHLRQGGKVEETLPLQTGTSYMFFAAGDSQASDVNLSVLDYKGHVVRQDIKPDAKAAFEVKPKYSGSHKMVLSLKSSKAGRSFCVVTVLSTKGYDVPLDDLGTVGGASLTAVSRVAATYGGHIYDRPGSWAFYGAVIQKGTNLGTDYKLYPSGPFLFLGVGDKSTKDLDMYLVNTQEQAVAGSTQAGSTPYIAANLTQGKYSVAVSNNYSTRPGFAMLTILDLSSAPGGGSSGGGSSGASTSAGGVRGGITVYMNNQPLNLGAVQVGGRVLVPMRAIFEAIGATVRYDPNTRVIQSTLDGDTLTMQVGNVMANDSGEMIQLDAPPQIINGVTMIPLRFIGEAMGAKVRWDAARRAVFIEGGDESDNE